ncbi:hypothetical protein BBFGKLBO_00669 [Synechococcus sp. CBW1107]|uniref:hypothetical protein n=1 Tax=Synechococcus sp. CBW1107 TaxID=2789857 RepID=UPI002AD59878|nr:hypothetical protein [Synechococcus sp. CBW1107]CAK6689692.1 hypothetical protein BBFGKLBO_00669 [Synechococcus sp. CBW1107]
MAVRQHRHPLIPRARAPESEQALMDAATTFRASFQQLLQRRIGEVLGEEVVPAPELRQRWPELRRQLDACPLIQAAHQRRAALQDQLWATVRAAIAGDRQRLEAVAHSQRRGPGSLQLTADLAIPAHQLKVDIHRMPGVTSTTRRKTVSSPVPSTTMACSCTARAGSVPSTMLPAGP